MWYDGYPFGAPEPSYKPTPQKFSPSTLIAPNGQDWVRRPCYGHHGTGATGAEGCPDCGGRQVGWQPDRPLPEGGKKHPLEGRYRRDENGQWVLGPLTVDQVVNAFPTTPEKRIHLPPHPSFGGASGYFGGP